MCFVRAKLKSTARRRLCQGTCVPGRARGRARPFAPFFEQRALLLDKHFAYRHSLAIVVHMSHASTNSGCGSIFQENGGCKWQVNLPVAKSHRLRVGRWEIQTRLRCSAAWPAAPYPSQERVKRRANRWRRKHLRLCKAEIPRQRPGRWPDPWFRSRRSRTSPEKLE